MSTIGAKKFNNFCKTLFSNPASSVAATIFLTVVCRAITRDQNPWLQPGADLGAALWVHRTPVKIVFFVYWLFFNHVCTPKQEVFAVVTPPCTPLPSSLAPPLTATTRGWAKDMVLQNNAFKKESQFMYWCCIIEPTESSLGVITLENKL